MTRRWKIFAAVGIVSLVLDQLTKYWARAVLPHDGTSIDVIANFWSWRLSYNTGSAFGLFGSVGGARVFLTIVGVVAVGAIVWMVRQARDDQTRLSWALGLVAGGAVGNIIDRLMFGKVTDFVVWRYYEKEWPTFNIADVALVIGVGLLFLDFGKDKKDKRDKKNKNEQAEAVQDQQESGRKTSKPKSKKKKKKRANK